MSGTTTPQSVELNNLENAVLKSAVMVLLGALAEQPAVVALGVIGGQGALQILGKDGLTALTAKFETHRVATQGDGTFVVESPIIVDASAEGN